MLAVLYLQRAAMYSAHMPHYQAAALRETHMTKENMNDQVGIFIRLFFVLARLLGYLAAR